MSFFFRWIRREITNDKSWVLLFIFSLGLGLFGFVGLESFRTSLEQALRARARTFLSADLAASSRRTIAPGDLDRMRQLIQPVKESHLTELFSMAASPRSSRLVQLKAIDQFYPLYGEMTLGSGQKIRTGDARVLERKAQVWVYPELLSQLELKIGDSLRLGSFDFEVTDTITDDSTQTFRLGGLAPKIYLSRKFLNQTGLIGFGTTFSDVYLFQIPVENDDELTGFARHLENAFPDPNLQFSTPYDRAQETSRTLQLLLDYLGLVSLVGLALSLVGIAYLLQLFLARRIPTLSLLRTLGLKVRSAELFLLCELTILGSLSSLLVLPLAAIVLPLLGSFINRYLPIPLDLSLRLSTIITSLILSALLPVLVAWPLLRPLREVNLKQVLLDRELWKAPIRGRMLWTWLPAIFTFFALSVWVSHSVKTAGFFLAGLLASAVLIIFVSVILLKSFRGHSRDWVWTQARLRLARAPLRFSVVVLALSFGTLLLVMLPQIRSSLKMELASPEATRLPSLFLFDIQDDQVTNLSQFLKNKGFDGQNLSPLIRSRLLTINGQPFERSRETAQYQSREEENEARFRNRGINLTVRSQISPSEQLEEGDWFSAQPGDLAELSIEVKYAERLGIKMGDLLKFDIQGVEIEGRVKNFRAVRWNSFQPNFFISFQPGFLEDAPKTWLMSVPSLPESRKVELQNQLVAQFPNVSMVDVSRVVTKVLELTDQMAVALTGMAVLSVIVGLFVLFTVLVTEARNRMTEWNLYKVLGAEQSQVLKLFLIESSAIALISVLFGAGLGTALSFILTKWLFDAPFVFDFGSFLLAMGVPFLITLILSRALGVRLTQTDASTLLAEAR